MAGFNSRSLTNQNENLTLYSTGPCEPALRAPRCSGQSGCLGWEAHQPLGSTDSYARAGCDSTDVCYWSGDIFHLESCILSSICANGEEIFELGIGQDWRCELSDERLEKFKRTLLSH